MVLFIGGYSHKEPLIPVSSRPKWYGTATVAMASIIQINGKWRAQIRRAGHKPITKTHPTKTAAQAWARAIEAKLDAGLPAGPVVTVGDLIKSYRKLRDAARPILDDSSEHYTLKTLADMLGGIDAAKLSTEDLVDFAQQRRDGHKGRPGVGAYTVNCDISKLATVLRYAASAKNLLLPDSVGIARPLLKHLGLIGGGGKRERRPTEDELLRIVQHLKDGRGLVYAEAVLFAVATAMRRGEICALKWADIDEAKRLALVRDRKDPRQKVGNDQWIPLLPEAWAIVQRQPRGDRVFPIEPGTLSKYFTEACRALSIPDLHLHDMRHEGTSQLFEAGYEIQQVAMVTGHKTWANLKRYTNLKPEDLHKD